MLQYHDVVTLEHSKPTSQHYSIAVLHNKNAAILPCSNTAMLPNHNAATQHYNIDILQYCKIAKFVILNIAMLHFLFSIALSFVLYAKIIYTWAGKQVPL